MRLVCPNCEAKYEVPEDAIPETGRDVQCANCGHAWYQMRSRSTAAEAASTGAVAPAAAASAPTAPLAPPPTPAPAADTAPVIVAETDELSKAAGSVDAKLPEPVVGPDAEAEVVATHEAPPVAADAEGPVAGDADRAVGVDSNATTVEAADDPALATPDAEETPTGAEQVAAVASVGVVPAIEAAVVESVVAEGAAEPPVVAEGEDLVDEAPTTAAPAAYAVDESVLAILREEAEREAEARRAEASRPLETQPDLGMEAAIAAKQVDSAAPVATDAIRRTRLPDVEEINSTLRPAESEVEEGLGPEAAPAEARSSFRSGFLLVLTMAILGSAVYGSADALASAVPALAGPLKAYVSFVDSLRLHLDGLMQSATVAINGN